MRWRSAVALTGGCLIAAAAFAGTAAQIETGVTIEHAEVGGLSGIVVTGDGTGFLALSDRTFLVEGQLIRDADGALTAAEVTELRLLTSPKGEVLEHGSVDTEGLAIGPKGEIAVSLEGPRVHGSVWIWRDEDKATRLPPAPDNDDLRINERYEALAVDAEGRYYIVPEMVAEGRAGFPLWRLEDGEWSEIATLEPHSRYRPVGADIGPDGKFYLLERAFFLGFSNRVRRFDLTDGVTGGDIVWESSGTLNANFEGLSVWQDGDGQIRLVMVADNNFLPFLRNDIIEVTLAKQDATR